MKYADLTEAALRANIEHFKAVRNQHADLALKAYAEEQKCEMAIKMKNNPETALNQLLTSK